MIKNTLTIEEAEKYYKSYNGFGFHMWHDDTIMYKKFKNANIPDEIIQKWNDEIITDMFNTLWLNQSEVWFRFENLLERIFSSKHNLPQNALHLLNELEKMTSLDKFQKILIIETMAGRNTYHSDGGCALYYSKTKLFKKMHKIMLSFMDFECDISDYFENSTWEEMAVRLDAAKSGYFCAYKNRRKIKRFMCNLLNSLKENV